MTLPSDPLEALHWAWNHSDHAWWIIGAIGAGIAWTSKRLRDWKSRNTIRIGPAKPISTTWTRGAAPAPAPAAASPAGSSYIAAASYAATAYAAQPAYAAPPAGPSPAGSARKLHREMSAQPPAQRAAGPHARSVDVPVASGAWTLTGAFGDPAHARTAVVIAEVLGPPVGLR